MCQVNKKEKKFVVNSRNKHENVPETERIIVDEKGGFFDFTQSFVCLGLTLTFLLHDAVDMKNGMLKATKAMGALNFAWKSKEPPKLTKYKLHAEIALNLLL